MRGCASVVAGGCGVVRVIVWVNVVDPTYVHVARPAVVVTAAMHVYGVMMFGLLDRC